MSLNILNPVAFVALGTAKYMTSNLSVNVIVLPATLIVLPAIVKSKPCTN